MSAELCPQFNCYLKALRRFVISIRCFFQSNLRKAQLIHIFAELTAVQRMQALWLLDQHVNQAKAQVTHERG